MSYQFKSKTEKAVKKIMASITLSSYVYIGTFLPYYALADIQSPPEPLQTQIGDPYEQPESYFLKALLNPEELISMASESVMYLRVYSNEKIIEPYHQEIQGERYIPYRLYEKNDGLYVETKSKKGSQMVLISKLEPNYVLSEKSESQERFMKLSTQQLFFEYMHSEKSSSAPASSSPPESLPTPKVPMISPEYIASPSVEEPLGFLKKLYSSVGISTAQAQKIELETWERIQIVSNSFAVNYELRADHIKIRQNFKLQVEDIIYPGFVEIILGFDGAGYVNKWTYAVEKYSLSDIDSEFKFRGVTQTNIKGKVRQIKTSTGSKFTGTIKETEAEFIELPDGEEEIHLTPIPIPEISPEILPASEYFDDILIPSLTPLPEDSPTPAPSEVTETPLPSDTPALLEPELTPLPVNSGSPADESAPSSVTTPELPLELTPEKEPLGWINIQKLRSFVMPLAHAEELPEIEVISEGIIPPFIKEAATRLLSPTPSEILPLGTPLVSEPLPMDIASESEKSIVIEDFSEEVSLPEISSEESISIPEPLVEIFEPIIEKISEFVSTDFSVSPSLSHIDLQPDRFTVLLSTQDHKGEKEEKFNPKKQESIMYFYSDPLASDSEYLFYVDPSFGTETNPTGITIQSGDGTKTTDFKVHFNSQKGGVIDELYLGDDFMTNKVAVPGQENGGLTLINIGTVYQVDYPSILTIEEQSDVRVVVKNELIFSASSSMTEYYTIYSTGRIIKKIITRTSEPTNQKFYFNGHKDTFDVALVDVLNSSHLFIADGTVTKDLLMSWQNPSQLASATFDQTETDSSLNTSVMIPSPAGGHTYYQLIEISREDISLLTPDSYLKYINDWRSPDTPVFTLGAFWGVNNDAFSYEMESAPNRDRVVFKLNGASIPRIQPVFEIYGWKNDDLGKVKGTLNEQSMIEGIDYVIDFKNKDPGTETLIFHFLGTVSQDSDFTTDGIGTFDIDPEVVPGDGRLIWDDGTALSTAPYCSDPASGCSGADRLGTFASVSTTFNPNMVQERAAPTRNEHLVGNLSGSGNFEVLKYNGSTWTVEWTEANVGSSGLDTVAFDIAYETSGEAVVAWSQSNSNVIEYKVYDGTNWTASASYTVQRTSSRISWIDMESHPASSSNQNDIGLCYVAGAPDTKVGCVIWNGDTNTFGNEPSTILESDGEEDVTAAGSDKSMAVFYEQSSAQLVAVWGIEHPGNNNSVGIGYTTFDAATGWAATAGFNILSAATSDGATDMDCSPMPTISSAIKNKAACIARHDEALDMNGFIWDGSGFGNGVSLDTGTTTSSGGRMPHDVMWLVDGTNRVAFVMWGSQDTTDVDWSRWDDAGGAWLAAQSFTSPTTGNEITYFGQSNPNEKNKGVFFLQDNSTTLWGYKASVSETTVTIANLNNGTPISLDLAGGLAYAADFAYDIAPVPTQAHFIWRNDDGDLTTATNISAQDVAASGSEALDTGTVKRLRIEISNEGAGSSSNDKWRLEMTKKGATCATPASGWAWQTVPLTAVTASDSFDIEATANFTDGASTSHYTSLTADDPVFTAGYALDNRATSGFQTINGNQYTEFEWALKPNSNAIDGTRYCFRVARTLSAVTVVYNQYAEAEVNVAGVNPTYTQNTMRWYANADVLSPTDPWPLGNLNDFGENFATISAQFASPDQGIQIRLRMNILVGNATLTAGSQSFKLQFAEVPTGSVGCGGVSSWTDMGASTSSSVWRFGSNPSVTDDTVILPFRLSSTNASGSYEEANNTRVNFPQVNVGESLEYDFSLQNNTATGGSMYCFRIARPSGSALEGYNRYPVIITPPSQANPERLLRHGSFFSKQEYEQPYFWSGITTEGSGN